MIIAPIIQNKRWWFSMTNSASLPICFPGWRLLLGLPIGTTESTAWAADPYSSDSSAAAVSKTSAGVPASRSSRLAASAGKKKRFQVRLYHILFAAAYVYQVGWVVSTIGRPYREFLEKADREGFKGTSSTSQLCV